MPFGCTKSLESRSRDFDLSLGFGRVLFGLLVVFCLSSWWDLGLQAVVLRLGPGIKISGSESAAFPFDKSAPHTFEKVGKP